MATELYLSVVYNPSLQSEEFLHPDKRTGLHRFAIKRPKHLTILEDTARQLEASLRRYEPQRLGTYTKHDIVYSEMLAFLGYLINGVWEEIPFRRAPLTPASPPRASTSAIKPVWWKSGIRMNGNLRVSGHAGVPPVFRAGHE